MFSRNKKKRRRSAPSASKEALLAEEYQKLDAKIGVLEDFIVGTVIKEQRRQQMRARNILPPPEQWRDARKKKRQADRKGRWEERRYLADRERSGLTFLALFLGFCTLVWLLIKAGV